MAHSGSNPALPPHLLQVPATVKFIHRWLVSNKDVSAEHRLDKSLLELTHAHPSDVVVTLLYSAPSCERYGAHLPLEPIPLQSPSCVSCQTDGEFQDSPTASFPSSGMSAPGPAAMLPP